MTPEMTVRDFQNLVKTEPTWYVSNLSESEKSDWDCDRRKDVSNQQPTTMLRQSWAMTVTRLETSLALLLLKMILEDFDIIHCG